MASAQSLSSVPFDFDDVPDRPEGETIEPEQVQLELAAMIPGSIVGLWRAWDPSDLAHDGQRAGRNDPCPCGSGRKFKKCCLG
jgi:uncharacterized protein YecA (UPF0149 family)